MNKNVKMSVFGIFNKDINFSTKSVKKTKLFMTCYSKWPFILLKLALNIRLK